MSNHPYIPNTDADRAEMLRKIGVSTFNDLIANVPAAVRWTGDLPVPAAVTEQDVVSEMEHLSGRNMHTGVMDCYLGAGAYDHFIPSIVNHVISRSEFYTAYTPYQPEVSQGTLQTIYEYQTMMAELLGLDVANASMYDGASAAAEAVLLAFGHTGRNRVIVSETVNPRYRAVMDTYAGGQGCILEFLPHHDGVTDPAALTGVVDETIAAVVVQFPNYFGCLEDVQAMADIAHAKGALLIVCADLVTLGVLEAPGALGADIAVAEGQAFGNALNFGGPYLGVFATTMPLIRKMPGRLVGRTTDLKGREGFVLTLQTREQHIRREKATSNICTNQALCALAACVHLTVLGPGGLRDLAHTCMQKAHYLADSISKLAGFSLAFDQPFAREFVIQTPAPAGQIVKSLETQNILAGLPLGDMGMANGLLIAVTEKRTKAQMDRFIAALEAAGRGKA